LRVDENRARLGWFVVLFVVGSALLLDAALIGLPGALLSVVFAQDRAQWFSSLGAVMAAAFGVLLASGALVCAVQLSNAEHWVRSRFAGRDFTPESAPEFASAVHDMSLAAGLPATPRIVVLDAPAGSINALALGTTRAAPLIGVTQGFLERLDVAEQRAVVATLVARIVAGDIMFGTALAALMGPLKAIRESRKAGGEVAGVVGEAGCGDPGCSDMGCADGCLDSASDAEGCAGLVGVVVFVVVVAFVTYVAVVCAA
jgi:Zn-dependent protease with chaperone function